jgi:hypothetical protein
VKPTAEVHVQLIDDGEVLNPQFLEHGWPSSPLVGEG